MLSETDLFISALALPEQQRAELAHALLDSLTNGETAEIDEAWRVEIERRLADYDAGRTTAIPAEQVFAKYKRNAS